METADICLVFKLARIGLNTKKYRTYKKEIKIINPILKANGIEPLRINSKKKK